MNVSGVNNVLLRAIHLFQQGEIEALQGGDGQVQFEGIEQSIATFARAVAEEAGCSFEEALDISVDVLGEAAANHFVSRNEECTEEAAANWTAQVVESESVDRFTRVAVERLQG